MQELTAIIIIIIIIIIICNSVRNLIYVHFFWTSVSNEETNIPHTVNRRKTNWIGRILHRNCLLKHVIEGKIAGKMEVMERRGRRRKQLLDDIEENERVL